MNIKIRNIKYKINIMSFDRIGLKLKNILRYTKGDERVSFDEIYQRFIEDLTGGKIFNGDLLVLTKLACKQYYDNFISDRPKSVGVMYYYSTPEYEECKQKLKDEYENILINYKNMYKAISDVEEYKFVSSILRETRRNRINSDDILFALVLLDSAILNINRSFKLGTFRNWLVKKLVKKGLKFVKDDTSINEYFGSNTNPIKYLLGEI